MDEIQLQILTGNKNCKSLNIQANETILKLKEMIAIKTNISPNRQILKLDALHFMSNMLAQTGIAPDYGIDVLDYTESRASICITVEHLVLGNP